jgi:hypothetical protein
MEPFDGVLTDEEFNAMRRAGFIFFTIGISSLIIPPLWNFVTNL